MNNFQRFIHAARRSGAEGAINLSQRRAWFATPMSESQFAALTNLNVALRAVFEDQLMAVVGGTSLLNTLYNVDGSQRAVERNQGMGGFSNVKRFGAAGTIEYDSYEPNYRADYTHVEYDLGMAVERKLIDDDEYGEIRSRATKLGLAFDRSVEVFAASTFTNAFNSTGVDIDGTAITTTGPDAVALCSTAHPNSPTDSATQSNKSTSTTLTHDNVIAAKQAMRRFKDSRGNPMNIMPDTILVPIELEQPALVIANSPQKSGTANNDVNVNSNYRVVVSPYLTDTNDWFLIDSRAAKMYLKWYWRVRPEFEPHPASVFDLIFRYRGYMRLSYGWDHWCWIYGNSN